MARLQIALHALGAEHAAVDRELLAGLEADDLVVLDLELDPALEAAEAAVGLHLTVGLARGAPAAGRRGVQVGAVLLDQQLLGDRQPSHGGPPGSPAPGPARTASACRP